MFLYYNFASNPHRTTQCISLASRATPPSALLSRKSLSVAHSHVFVPAVAAHSDFINLRCLTWRNHQFGIAPVRCQSPRPIFAFEALHSSTALTWMCAGELPSSERKRLTCLGTILPVALFQALLGSEKKSLHSPECYILSTFKHVRLKIRYNMIKLFLCQQAKISSSAFHSSAIET